MTNETLMRLFDHLVADARKTMAGKNHDYTAASQDALANFKTVAQTLGLKPRQVWAVYLMKHVMAVLAWAKTGKVESEGMTGRFVDLINYAAIGQAIYETADSGPEWDFAALWDDQSQWSQKTFGTDQERGPAGSLKHLIKEAQEALQKPQDAKEYADLIILVCDASRRAGLTREALLKAAHAKMAENKQRVWPKPVDGEPCEHVRDEAVRDEERHPWKSPPLTGPNPYLKSFTFQGATGRTATFQEAAEIEAQTPITAGQVGEALARLKVGQGFLQDQLKKAAEQAQEPEDWGQATS